MLLSQKKEPAGEEKVISLNQLRYAIALSDERSMNTAAAKLFISQPSLSAAIKELEEETGIEIFRRSNRGITLTPEGVEFIGYARQVIEQYSLLESRYISHETLKDRFAVSTQHYSFVVEAFVKLVKLYGMDEYDLAVKETKTNEIISDVKDFRSEMGILYENDFNKKVLEKIFAENGLSFHPLFDCSIYVYLWKGHPLSGKKEIVMEELEEYPCLSFSQGQNNSFYFAEEVLSTYEYKRTIKANDRATMLNLMRGLNGFTLCSGIISENLNGDDYCAIPLKSPEKMTVGYIKRKGIPLSPIAKQYLEILSEYEKQVLS